MLGNFYAISNLAVAILIDILGVFVYVQNTKAQPNRRFIVFCFGFSAWMYSLFILYYFGKEPVSAIFWSKSIYVGACFASVLSYHFFIRFLDIRKNRSVLYLLYILSFVFLFLTYTDKLLGGLYYYAWGYFPKFGKYHPLFMIYLISANIYALSLLYDKYRHRATLTDQEFQRVKYVFSAWIMAASASANFLPTYGFNVYPIGNFLALVMVLLLSYAVLRHQLLDIEVIIKKTLVFAGLLASVFAMLVLPTLIIQEYLFRVAGPGVRMAGLTISGLIIIFTVRRIEDFLINVTDRYLFQKKYDYKELLKTFTTEVLTVLDLNNLTNLTVQKLSNIVKPNSCAILLLDEQTDELKLSSSRGLKDNKITLSKRNELVTFLEKSQTYVLKSQSTPSAKIPDVILNNMARLEAEMVVPLILHEKFIGMLSLGKKKSDENYTQDDIDILLPLARTLAIAISNAELFDELGKTQAEAAQREKMAVIGTLASGINHEICNPLGIARGQCEAFLLNRKDGIYKNKSEAEQLNEVTRIMELVIKETDRATAITKKLSSFAKPSKGEVADSVDIAKEIDEVLALVGYELKMDKIELAKNIPANLPHIRADKKQLQEIFFNLIRNAAQAIKETGRITVSAQELDSKIIIDITDTGSGISEDKVEMIFNPFYTTKEPGKGTGLGLFIVRQVVERNKGKISLKSKINEGTTFTLEFPITSERR